MSYRLFAILCLGNVVTWFNTLIISKVVYNVYINVTFWNNFIIGKSDRVKAYSSSCIIYRCCSVFIRNIVIK